jgi:hypothetical protein
MTLRRTVLNVEQLGARVLPSATVTIPAATTSVAKVSTTTVTTTTGVAWTGQGRFTITTNKSTNAKTYALDGSAAFGSSGFFAISGSLTTVGNKSGTSTGTVVLSDPRGKLTLSVTGSTQAANSALPASYTYKVVSGTGFFAHYAGTGSFKITPQLFAGDSAAGHFSVTTTAPVNTTTVPTTPKPPTPPPVQTTTGPSWTGQGRYTLAKNTTTSAKTYTLQGSADFGSSGFFAIGGTIQTVGNKAGQATGRITLSNSRGTLTLQVTGPTQAKNAGVPSSFTYKVLSGTGFFAHYAGQGTFQISTPLFLGYDDKGQFQVAVKPTSK